MNEKEVVEFLYELKNWKSFAGRKWLDEIEKSLGANVLLKQVFKHNTSMIKAFCELAEKPSPSQFRTELERDAFVGEKLLAQSERRPNPEIVIKNFKRVVGAKLVEELPILFNKYESMLNERVKPKHDEFNKIEKE